MKATSFEGQYKTPNTISYNREKQWSAKDIKRNAEQQRILRAETKIRNEAIRKMQENCRIKLEKKKKHAALILSFQKDINFLKKDRNTSDKIEVAIKCADCLLLFFKSSTKTDHLKLLIRKLIESSVVPDIIRISSSSQYYNLVTLGLLIRLTARVLSTLPKITNPTNYNTYLRFLEITYYEVQHSISLNELTKRAFFLILTGKLYFLNVTDFFVNQFMTSDTFDIVNQPKLNTVINVILQPLQQTKSLPITKDLLIHFVSNNFNRPHNQVELLNYMSKCLITNVYLTDLVNTLFDDFYGSRKISPHSGVVYLLLICCRELDDEVLVPELCKKIVILVAQICKELIRHKNLFSSKLCFNVNKPTDNDSGSESDSSEDSNADFYTNSHKIKVSNKMDVENLTDEQTRLINVDDNIANILKQEFGYVAMSSAVKCEEGNDQEWRLLIDSIGYIYHLLVFDTKILSSDETKPFILSLIQDKNGFTKKLWKSCTEQTINKAAGKTIMQLVIDGHIIEFNSDVEEFFGKLLCFANCLHWRLLSVQDLDLIRVEHENYPTVMEFSTKALCEIVMKLRDIMYGLILLVYPTSLQVPLMPVVRNRMIKIFTELQRVLNRLYNRDVRKGLQMTGKRLDWVKSQVFKMSSNMIVNLRDEIFRSRKFGEMKFGGLSMLDIRQIVILKEMPFLVPFGTRMKLFKEMINSLNNGVRMAYGRSAVQIRRDYIYEDAFSQITLTNYPDIRNYLKIEFIDRHGMIEAGIDGGGLLREFLASVLKDCCDPNRGLFVTTNNNLLYPNPEVDVLYPDNWKNHYFFFGRMLGLMICKGMLVEIPFAPFFIQRLFAKRKCKEEIDIDNLQYLDQEMYRNLLSLKNMTNVEDMSLDFTLTRSRYGESKVVELKPNGSETLVTNSNKIEYIYMVANYRLNVQIADQTSFIGEGVDNVLSLESFQLFNSEELGIIITGGGTPIDIKDLKQHTVYHGMELYADSERVITDFWSVLEDMCEEERRNFIQFVTSNTRPPLLGFGDLSPNFAIQLTGEMDRLPSASTCVNLLKLPCYKTREQMRSKLLIAIGSESGFHLS